MPYSVNRLRRSLDLIYRYVSILTHNQDSIGYNKITGKVKKYFGLRVEYLKQEMRHVNLNIQKINGKFNPTDILLKPVPGSLFKKLLVVNGRGLRIEEETHKRNETYFNYVECWKYESE